MAARFPACAQILFFFLRIQSALEWQATAAATWIRPFYVPYNRRTKFWSSVDVVANDEIRWNILHVINASIRSGSTVPIMSTLSKRRCLSSFATSSSTSHPTRRRDIRHCAASCHNCQCWSLLVQTPSSTGYQYTWRHSVSYLPIHSISSPTTSTVIVDDAKLHLQAT